MSMLDIIAIGIVCGVIWYGRWIPFRWYRCVKAVYSRIGGMILLSSLVRLRKLVMHMRAYPVQTLVLVAVVVSTISTAHIDVLWWVQVVGWGYILTWCTQVMRASIESPVRMTIRTSWFHCYVAIVIGLGAAYTLRPALMCHASWVSTVLMLLPDPACDPFLPSVVGVVWGLLVWDTFQSLCRRVFLVRIIRLLYKCAMLIASLYPVLLITTLVPMISIQTAVYFFGGILHDDTIAACVVAVLLPLLIAWIGSWYTWAVHTWYEEFTYVL